MQVLAHNLTAQFTQKQLNISTKNKSKSTERLSTGYRINRAADDAAGLTVSEKMRWQVKGLDKATNNCEDGASYCQVADGAMQEIGDIMQRMRELSVQAANDTNTDADRQAIQNEINALTAEIGRITTDTEFNDTNVFGWERTKTVYTPDASGNLVPSNSTNIPVTGNNYGLSEVLGNGKVYSGSKLDDQVQFDTSTGTKWTTTGKNLYGWNQTAADIVQNINRNNQLNVSDADFESGYSGIRKITGNGYTLSIEYGPDKNLETGQYLATDISLEQDGNQAQGISSTTLSNWNLNQSIGSAGVDNGDAYGAAWMDFSGLGTDFQISDLYGQGFNSTCASCSRYYSIKFTGDNCATTNADGTNYTFVNSSDSPRLDINISDCTTGEQIVDKIMSAVKSCDKMNNHYTQYAKNSAEPGKLYVYDNRNRKKDGGSSTFEPASRNESGQLVIGDTVINQPPNVIRYSTRQMWIQSGTTNMNGFFIERPEVDVAKLGIAGVSVLDYDGASAAISTCDSAIDYLNEQRSKVGAQQNRLEKASLVDSNTSENTQAAESRLRDADMAEEMVQNAKHNILEQTGMAMLSYNMKDVEGILKLLQ